MRFTDDLERIADSLERIERHLSTLAGCMVTLAEATHIITAPLRFITRRGEA